MSYKTRKIQTIVNSITYEKNNLIRLFWKIIPSNSKFRLSKREVEILESAIEKFNEGLIELSKIKGITNN